MLDVSPMPPICIAGRSWRAPLSRISRLKDLIHSPVVTCGLYIFTSFAILSHPLMHMHYTHHTKSYKERAFTLDPINAHTWLAIQYKIDAIKIYKLQMFWIFLTYAMEWFERSRAETCSRRDPKKNQKRT